MPEKMSANRARDSRETVRRKRRERTKENLEFYECIRDIVSHPAVLEMKSTISTAIPIVMNTVWM